MSAFWKYLVDNEVMQRADIEGLRSSVRVSSRHARRRSAELRDRVEELETELGEIRLFSRALLSLLQETGALDPTRLRAKLLELDAADGTIDGRYEPEPEPEPETKPAAPIRRRKDR